MAREGRAVLTAALVTVLTSMPLFVIGALAPQLKEQAGVTATEVGAAVAAYTCAQAISATALTRATTRVSVGTILRWSLIVAAVSLLVISAVGIDRSLLLAAAAIGGLAAAMAQPASSDYVVRSVSAASYGRTFGILQASKPIAVLLIGVAVSALTATRTSSIVLPAAGAALCVALALTPVADPAARREDTAARVTFRRTAALFLAGFAGLSLGTGTTMVSFLPLSTVDAGLDVTSVALLMAVGSGVAIVVRVSIGVFADRQHIRPMTLAAVLSGLGAVGYAMLAVHDRGLEPFGALLAFAGGWGSTGLLYLASAASGIGSPSRVTAIVVAGGGIGSATIPLAFGATATAWGYGAAWIGLAALAAGASLLAALVARDRPSRMEATHHDA